MTAREAEGYEGGRVCRRSRRRPGVEISSEFPDRQEACLSEDSVPRWPPFHRRLWVSCSTRFGKGRSVDKARRLNRPCRNTHARGHVEVKTMSHRKLLMELRSLPPDAQRQVSDLIAILKKQHEQTIRPTKQNGAGLSRQPFIGMWRDRDDLKDSSAWVRKTRLHEWSDA